MFSLLREVSAPIIIVFRARIIRGSPLRLDRADRGVPWIGEIEDALIIRIAADDFAIGRQDRLNCQVLARGERLAVTFCVLEVIVVTERREQRLIGSLRRNSQREQCKRYGVKKFHRSASRFLC